MPAFFSSKAAARGFAALVLGASLAAAVTPGCSHSNLGASAEQSCQLNSDCERGLICALGRCRVQCATDADCGDGGACVDNGDVAVCQSPADHDTPCDNESQCPAPLACASDYRCRNLCTTSADCNVLGITGRVCAKDANGVDYCADPSEVTNGTITAPPPPGAPDGGVIEPSFDASMQGDSARPDGTSPLEAGGDTSNAVDTSMPGACEPACPAGSQCVSGTCCGAVSDPCCGSPGTCTSPLVCAGIVCSCLTAAFQDAVVRSDGSFWSYPGNGAPSAVLQANGNPFLGTAFAEMVDIGGCGVRSDGTVWCWGSSNEAGELGTNDMTASTVPVQVQLSSGVLSGITNVFAGDNGNAASVCAINASGAVWCWGSNTSGNLGTGSMASALVATPVVTGSGGGQFMGVTQMSLASDHTCARTSDGSAWCWGSNNSGQVGAPLAQSQYLYPTQVPTLTGVVAVAATEGDSCAVLNDGSVWCWGDDSSGQLGNGTSTSTPSATPTRVVTGPSGSPLGGIKQVATYGTQTCAINTSDAMLCWGAGFNNQVGPGVFMGAAITGVFALGVDGQDASWIDTQGVFHLNGEPQMGSSAVPCP
jgi:hypothetical protein